MPPKYNPKYTCGDRATNSRCVFYDLPRPEFSKATDDEDFTIHEATEDIYKYLEYLDESIDTSELGKKCLDYPVVKNKYNKEPNTIMIKDVLKVLEENICDILEATSEESDDSLELDFKCLISPCQGQIGSLKDLLQVLINEVCELKNKG